MVGYSSWRRVALIIAVGMVLGLPLFEAPHFGFAYASNSGSLRGDAVSQAPALTDKATKTKDLKKGLTLKKLITVKKAQGTVRYKNVSKGKKLAKFKVNAKTGAIVVPKGTKKGVYKVKIKVTAKGNANFKSGSKSVLVKVTVK